MRMVTEMDQDRFMEGWVTFSGLILAALGLFLGADIVADLSEINNQLIALMPELVSLIGLVVAFFGRLRAKKPMFNRAS